MKGLYVIMLISNTGFQACLTLKHSQGHFASKHCAVAYFLDRSMNFPSKSIPHIFIQSYLKTNTECTMDSNLA